MDLLPKKVSVIVPVYNVEKYINKCIDSILNQTYKNIEIFLIDDGSKDSSGIICDEYAECDSRITVIHKENGGQNSARRDGVRKATGEYIMFVDSDDWIDEIMVEELLKLSINNNADIVTSGCIIEQYGNSSIIYDKFDEGNYIGENLNYILNNMIYYKKISNKTMRGSLWSKLIRREILTDILDNVDMNIRYGEDFAVLYCCFIAAKSITITHKYYYHYLMNSNSVSHSIIENHLAQLNYLYLFVKQYAIEKKCYDLIKNQLQMYIINGIFDSINTYMGFDKAFSLPKYLLRDELIPINSNIVLYGAGKVGQSVHKQIISENRLNIVLWVDKDYKKYSETGLDVNDISDINNVNFDYILICVLREELSKKIQENLEREYQIDSNKIKWAEPQNFLDKYINLDK